MGDPQAHHAFFVVPNEARRAWCCETVVTLMWLQQLVSHSVFSNRGMVHMAERQEMGSKAAGSSCVGPVPKAWLWFDACAPAKQREAVQANSEYSCMSVATSRSLDLRKMVNSIDTQHAVCNYSHINNQT